MSLNQFTQTSLFWTVFALIVAFGASIQLAIAQTIRWRAHRLVRSIGSDGHTTTRRFGLFGIFERLIALRRIHGRGLEAEQLELVSAMSRLTRGGSSLHVATTESLNRLPDGLLRRSGATMLSEANRVGFSTACQRWSEDPRMQLIAWTLAVLHQTGGDPSQALDAVGASLRVQQGLQREVRALTAQSTLSAAVMASVPVLFAALLSASDESARAFLFRHPIGQACAAVGLLLDVVAWRWLRRLGQVTW